MSARLTVRHAWLQKHATPAAQGGEFHWYPPAQAPDDAALRGWVVEQTQGLTAPAVWWDLAPGRLLWVSLFAATSTLEGDGRAYRGLTLSQVTGDAAPPELLAALIPPPAAPYHGTAVRDEASARAAGQAPSAAGDASAMARGLLRGGAQALGDPYAPALPGQLAALWRWLPPQLASARRGVWRAGASEPAADEVAAILAAAWTAPPGTSGRIARHAWHLLCELTQALGQRPEDLVRRSKEAAARGDARSLLSAVQLRRWTARAGAAAPPWRQLLHGWGRGWLDGDPAATAAGADEVTDEATDDLADVLAEELALRALAALRAGRGAGDVVAEARWHALLPAPRRGALWRALAARAPSLAAEPLGRPPLDAEPRRTTAGHGQRIPTAAPAAGERKDPPHVA